MRDGFIIKGSLCRLLSSVYVDRDPFRAVSLPRYYRDVDSAPLASVDNDDPRHFPCSPYASDLAEICTYTSVYISTLPGSTQLWRVSLDCASLLNARLMWTGVLHCANNCTPVSYCRASERLRGFRFAC